MYWLSTKHFLALISPPQHEGNNIVFLMELPSRSDGVYCLWSSASSYPNLQAAFIRFSLSFFSLGTAEWSQRHGPGHCGVARGSLQGSVSLWFKERTPIQLLSPEGKGASEEPGTSRICSDQSCLSVFWECFRVNLVRLIFFFCVILPRKQNSLVLRSETRASMNSGSYLLALGKLFLCAKWG